MKGEKKKRKKREREAQTQKSSAVANGGSFSNPKNLSRLSKLKVVRECREMREASLPKPELSLRVKRCIGGRNCHRKHVEDG